MLFSPERLKLEVRPEEVEHPRAMQAMAWGERKQFDQHVGFAHVPGDGIEQAITQNHGKASLEIDT